jgi:hypothetical protein
MTAFGYDFNCIGNPDHTVTSAFHGILSGFTLSYVHFIAYHLLMLLVSEIHSVVTAVGDAQ